MRTLPLALPKPVLLLSTPALFSFVRSASEPGDEGTPCLPGVGRPPDLRISSDLTHQEPDSGGYERHDPGRPAKVRRSQCPPVHAPVRRVVKDAGPVVGSPPDPGIEEVRPTHFLRAGSMPPMNTSILGVVGGAEARQISVEQSGVEGHSHRVRTREAWGRGLDVGLFVP